MISSTKVLYGVGEKCQQKHNVKFAFTLLFDNELTQTMDTSLFSMDDPGVRSV
jgi:hypothetical protein